mmetsp:Transcript_744/g.2860  ORF Transcript_744/g.2860 Transcript_744/m.2860 type:complete len:303 (+) Transcript_744:224-1132(+)
MSDSLDIRLGEETFERVPLASHVIVARRADAGLFLCRRDGRDEHEILFVFCLWRHGGGDGNHRFRRRIFYSLALGRRRRILHLCQRSARRRATRRRQRRALLLWHGVLLITHLYDDCTRRRSSCRARARTRSRRWLFALARLVQRRRQLQRRHSTHGYSCALLAVARLRRRRYRCLYRRHRRRRRRRSGRLFRFCRDVGGANLCRVFPGRLFHRRRASFRIADDDIIDRKSRKRLHRDGGNRPTRRSHQRLIRHDFRKVSQRARSRGVFPHQRIPRPRCERCELLRLPRPITLIRLQRTIQV